MINLHEIQSNNPLNPKRRFAIGAAVLAGMLALGTIIYFFTGGLNTVAMFWGKNPGGKGNINILVLGVDKRQDDVGRSDTIIVISVDPATKKAALLSIPRDTRVKIPGKGFDKINHAYAYGGHSLVARTVEDFLGIPIHRYVEVDFKGFEKIIDTLGGVTVDVEKRMYYEDPYDDLMIDLQPGVQKLNGEEAMWYVRFRHDEEGDIGRIKRQQHFLQALVKEAVKPSTFTKLPNLVRDFRSAVNTNLSTREMLQLANILGDAYRNGLKMEMVPGEGMYLGGVSYWKPDVEETWQLVSRLFFGQEELEAARKHEAQALALEYADDANRAAQEEENNADQREGVKIKVAILNGTGMPDLGDKAAAELRSQGFEVVSVSTAEGIYDDTLVLDHSTDPELAKAINALLGRYKIVASPDKNKDVTITFIIGKDYVPAKQDENKNKNGTSSNPNPPTGNKDAGKDAAQDGSGTKVDVENQGAKKGTTGATKDTNDPTRDTTSTPKTVNGNTSQ